MFSCVSIKREMGVFIVLESAEFDSKKRLAADKSGNERKGEIGPFVSCCCTWKDFRASAPRDC